MKKYMEEMEIKNLTKLFTILLLSEKEQHGYELMKEIEIKLGRKSSPGQIYPFLKQLKEHYYIESRGRAERDKQVYHLTPEGRRFVARLYNNLSNLLDIAIKQKLKTCAQCNCEVYRGGYKEKINNRYLDFCCRNCAKCYPAT